MRANYVGNTALQERLHRPDPEVRAIVEAVVVAQSDTKETDGEWSSADSQTGLTFPQIGGARLARDTDATLASYAVADADEGQVTTDVDNELPYHVIEVEWTAANASEWEIHDLTTKIDPDVDGSGREVDHVYAQLYQVTREDFDGEDTREIRAISARQSVEISGNAETTLTWNFSGGDVGEPPTADQGRETTRPKTWIIVRAVTSDGEPAGNIAWIGDTTESNPTTDDQSNANLRHYVIDQIDTEGRISIGGQYLITNPSPGGLPEFDIGSKDYTEETASFTGASNQIDLGASPDSDTDLVVVAQGEEPFDSSLTWEISDDSGSTWTEVVDGDVIGEDNTPDGHDLSGVSRQQTYDMRVTLTPTSDNRASPFARRIGVEEMTTTDLDGVASVEDAGNWSFDPVTLVGEIPEATISLLKDGVRDYRSEGERLFATNHIGDMTFRVWIGHPDLPRKNWLLVDAFEVDDTKTGGASIDAICLSPLRRLKVPIPPYDTGANERTPVEYTNQTLKAAWDDLIDSQVGLPARFRGPGVEDTTSQSVSKTLRDSDGKTELDAIAHLAGGAVVTSQGKVKYQDAFLEDKGGIKATFSREEIQATGIEPGFRNRVEEYFAPYAYDDDRDEFDGEVRSFYADAIAKIGGKGLDAPDELDEAAARWLPTPNDKDSNDPSQNLAAHVAQRTTSPNGLGPGLKQVRFESTIPHPELEPGDAVVVETDQLVIKDPATDTAFRGLLWLTGVVQVQHDVWGRELTVWVQQIEDAIPSEEDVSRTTSTGLAGTITFLEDRSAGEATVTVDIGGPGSYDVTIYRMDTDGTETQVASQTGITDGGGNDPFSHTESLRESEALPMRAEVSSSSGQLVQVDTATLDADEVADTTLSVHIRDDGTPVARGRMDLDGTGGVVHLTQANGSSPTASDPAGTEDTVDLSAGERLWEHVFSATVAKGDEVSVKALPETSGGDTAPPDRIKEAGDTRPGDQTTFDGTPTAELREDSRDPNNILYDLKVTSGSDVSDPDLRYRYLVTEPGTTADFSGQSWTGVSDANDGNWLDQAITASRSGKAPKQLHVQAQDQAPASSPTVTTSYPVFPNLDGLDDDDSGKVDPGSEPGGTYTPPGGGTPPTLAKYLDTSHEARQNLLSQDAGPEQSGTATRFYTPTFQLSTLSVEPGDVVSAGTLVRSETGADTVRLVLRWLDSGGANIRDDAGNDVTSSTYERSAVEDVTIPANAEELEYQLRNVNTTETAYSKKRILNRGPIAESFEHPPLRRERETAEDLLRAADSNSLETVTQMLGGGGSAQKEFSIGDFLTARHVETGSARNEDPPISFSQQYDTAPKLFFIPQVGKSFSVAEDGVDQKMDLRATNLDVNGFELVAELATSTTSTFIEDGFSGQRGAGAPEDGDVTLQQDGAVAYSNLEDEDDDTTTTTYTVYYDVQGPDGPQEPRTDLTVHVDVSDSTSGGGWVEVASKSYTSIVDVLTDESLSINANLLENYDIRLRLTGTNVSGNWTVTAHGEDHASEAGVQYDRVDGSARVSMTPSDGDRVFWAAMESSA